MLASRRCCSSAIGMIALLRSFQSGWPSGAPMNISAASYPSTPSRCSPAQATLPWRVSTMERARSYVNAAARPPLPPTVRVVTAGFDVAVDELLYRVARLVAPLRL
jgi:hypothetical protein